MSCRQSTDILNLRRRLFGLPSLLKV